MLVNIRRLLPCFGNLAGFTALPDANRLTIGDNLSMPRSDAEASQPSIATLLQRLVDTQAHPTDFKPFDSDYRDAADQLHLHKV